ncbi:MAG TPA: hypothetical protein VJ652_11105 [Noviherbaspirillum sp.]|nr:hypothetical protein [Noviherbaspirillum sp.]
MISLLEENELIVNFQAGYGMTLQKRTLKLGADATPLYRQET